MRNFKVSYIFLVLAFFSQAMWSCAIRVMNDTQQSALIVDTNGSIAMVLDPVDQNMNSDTLPVFGDPDQQAHFFLLTFDPSTHQYVAQKVIRQKACTAEHKATFKVSDLLAEKVPAEFKIESFQVRQKPSRAHDGSGLKLAYVSRDPQILGVNRIVESETSGDIETTENLYDTPLPPDTPERQSRYRQSRPESYYFES